MILIERILGLSILLLPVAVLLVITLVVLITMMLPLFYLLGVIC